MGLVHGYDSGSLSSGDDSAGSSVDSAERRARAAAKLVQDYGDAATSSVAAPSALPAVDLAFTQAAGTPAFLNPEATRQRKVCVSHLKPPQPADAAQQSSAANGALVPAVGDISKLAPKLKGEHDKGEAVLSAPAKRAREQKSTAGGAYGSSALVAMMGGSMGDVAGGQADAEASEQGSKPKRGKPTPAVDVSDFLAQGAGAQLPRKQQGKKDREQNKRMKGQSHQPEWKSEAEMVLRQQFDS